MPNALKKLQAGADKAHGKLAAKGFREHAVTLSLPSLTGKDPLLGTGGEAAQPDDTPIIPPPLVESVSLRLVEFSAGIIQTGDIKVSQVTRSLDEVLLRDNRLVWVVEGPGLAGRYQLVNLEARRTEYVAILRLIPPEASP